MKQILLPIEYKIHNFALPLGVEALPDDPKYIYDTALKYKEVKGKFDSLKDKYLGSPNLNPLEKIDNSLTDLGAGAGLGLTMAGAKLRQYKPTHRLGTSIKAHGINTLTDPNLQKMYGYGVPTAVIGGSLLAASKLPRKDNLVIKKENQEEYE